MPRYLNPEWKTKQIALIEDAMRDGIPYVHTTEFTLAKQWIVRELDRRNIPYIAKALGAGVVKYSTDTKTCPCCKKPL